jgi:hypothetical protein
MEEFETVENLRPAANGHREPDLPDLSDPEPFVTELCATERFFEAQAVAKVRIGERVVAFKIRSVPKEALERVMLESRPKNLPKLKTAQGTLVLNEEAPPYRQWLLTYGYLKVLLGFAELTLRDRAGQIVWQVPGEVQQALPAVQALKDLGITTQQVEDLTRQIDALSLLDAQEEQQAFF